MKQLNIQRHDCSDDNSLRPWSAADEYLLQSFNSSETQPDQLGLYNDRFGFLACQLHAVNPTIILTHKSQEKAIELNLKANKLSELTFNDPTTKLENKLDTVLMKIPKSLGLFQLFLDHISQNSTKNIVVSCAFMTRHFSPKMIEIAQEYFEKVEQSRAVKKARVLTLTKKKKVVKKDLTTSLEYNKTTYKQYLGVFSADHIDYATQFFLEHLDVNDSDETILDLASGNGIIAQEIYNKNKTAEIHLMDDFCLAVASAELNIKGENINHHYNNELTHFEDEKFDLIVTNPPFHFEHEVNIQIPIRLFKDCHRILKKGGSLQIVASQHLNYKTHLTPVYSIVEIIAENTKFIIYKCTK